MTPPPAPAADLEPEIEAVVEIEAEPPPLDDSQPEVTVIMEAGEPDELDDDDDMEMTVTIAEDLEEPTHTRAISANDAPMVSGTINDPPARKKRLSEGWEDK